jgi:hypothetical protein
MYHCTLVVLLLLVLLAMTANVVHSVYTATLQSCIIISHDVRYSSVARAQTLCTFTTVLLHSYHFYCLAVPTYYCTVYIASLCYFNLLLKSQML